MRAALTTTDGGFEVGTLDDPVPGPGELVLRVTACGICGSDLSAHRAMPAGTTMGHEFCGEVVAVGPGATRPEGSAWREGQAATALPLFGCGACPWCRSGQPAHCPSVRLTGFFDTAGGFAELVRVSAALAFPVPTDVADAFGALVEPFAVGLHAVRAADLQAGEHVLVLGAGPVGLTVAAWARASGAGDITVVDPSSPRRELSAAVGASAALAPGEVATGAFDVVFECAGKPGLLDASVAAARTQGRVVVAGVCAQPDPFVPIAAVMKEVSMRFCVYYRVDEFGAVIDAFAREEIDPSPLVTRRLPLDAIGEAFDRAASAGEGKVLVEPALLSGP